MKYHGNPNEFKKDFPSVYDEVVNRFEEEEKSLTPGPKDVDFFSFIDTGVFPFIIRQKMKEWNLGLDSFNMLSMLYVQRDFRNKPAHESGEYYGELDDASAHARYWNEKVLIGYFETKINE